jgi:hypothetical protein
MTLLERMVEFPLLLRLSMVSSGVSFGFGYEQVQPYLLHKITSLTRRESDTLHQIAAVRNITIKLLIAGYLSQA